MMTIRRAIITDIDPIRKLFYDTITTVNAADYNTEQITAWAAGRDNIARWEARIREQYFYVAEKDGSVAGFASITTGGYLDVLFVSKDFQRQGVAKLLINRIEQTAKELRIATITSDVSITARPFFEKCGFRVITQQSVEVRGVILTNFKMAKNIGFIDQVYIY
jgi:putative acetyltransferase